MQTAGSQHPQLQNAHPVPQSLSPPEDGFTPNQGTGTLLINQSMKSGTVGRRMGLHSFHPWASETPKGASLLSQSPSCSPPIAGEGGKGYTAAQTCGHLGSSHFSLPLHSQGSRMKDVSHGGAARCSSQRGFAVIAAAEAFAGTLHRKSSW